MKIKDFLAKEVLGFNIFEKVFFPLIIISTIIISFILNDNKIALVSAICGISYTILAGKGKITCYFIGILGTFCYCYLSFKNGFFGNLALYGLYFLPMQILGIFKWAKNLNKKTQTIIKTHLSKKERILYLGAIIILSIILSQILILSGDKSPYIDSIVTISSIVAQILTLKRCIEQWYIWFFVNLLTFIMWIIAYLQGSNCFATIIMWGVYIFLAVYFLHQWKRELTANADKI